MDKKIIDCKVSEYLALEEELIKQGFENNKNGLVKTKEYTVDGKYHAVDCDKYFDSSLIDRECSIKVRRYIQLRLMGGDLKLLSNEHTGYLKPSSIPDFHPVDPYTDEMRNRDWGMLNSAIIGKEYTVVSKAGDGEGNAIFCCSRGSTMEYIPSWAVASYIPKKVD